MSAFSDLTSFDVHDPSVFEELVICQDEDDPTFLRGVFDLYKTTSEECLSAMSESLEEGSKDLSRFGKEAHKLKGSAGQLGGNRMFELMARLQAAGEKSDESMAKEGLPIARKEHDALVDAIEDLFKENPEFEMWTPDQE